ncbi:phosphatase PAP2 family protein [Variovorax paradoxus]|uniref:phosphatase PAP2 family protein n=1 Tax=Variovorax paradoxus TaxID=34073 RepID=UPI0021AC6C83|nr:phosphatase PAP2 family protein [Variovorax paradoxus]UVH60576.1 phosphatase PAP2 family protein [Variovorax paradoxus]
MEELNLFLFLWMAAGHAPCPWLVSVAGALAVGGPWPCLALLGWTAWLYPRERGYLLAVLGCATLASMLAHALAAALNMPRPFMVGLSPAYIEHGARGSLPSAHATVMFTVALLCLRRPALHAAGVAIFAAASLTGWARIHVGVHFPADVPAGLLLAFAVAAVFAGLEHLCHRLFASTAVERAGRHANQLVRYLRRWLPALQVGRINDPPSSRRHVRDTSRSSPTSDQNA